MSSENVTICCVELSVGFLTLGVELKNDARFQPIAICHPSIQTVILKITTQIPI
jgi:hypothetical protein